MASLLYFRARCDLQLGSVLQPCLHKDSTSLLLRNPTGPELEGMEEVEEMVGGLCARVSEELQ